MNKKVNVLLILSFLLVLLLGGAYSYSKYVTVVDGNVNTDIANWNILVNGCNIVNPDKENPNCYGQIKRGNGSITLTKNFGISDFTYKNNGNLSDVVENKLAPGSSGTFKIVIEPTDTEVSVAYDLNVSLVHNNESIKLYRSDPNKKNKVADATILSEHITNLYKNALKTTVVNNKITYNYATSESLMNDRFGGSSLDYDTGNIRYYGANPNNYVYFNCDDSGVISDSTCELWRIVGVFDGKVKIVRGTSIGRYSLDADLEDNTSLNDWDTSTLNKLLNDGYYNNTDGNPYKNKNEINFAKDGIGLKTYNVRNMISSSDWYLGGYTDVNIYADEFYKYERYSNFYDNQVWNGNVGLIYPSDYGYAVDLSQCSYKMSEYENCISHNWLRKNTTATWTMTRNSSSKSTVFNIASNGNMAGVSNASLDRAVYPVVYLKEGVNFCTGNGTLENPYQINVGSSICYSNVMKYPHATNYKEKFIIYVDWENIEENNEYDAMIGTQGFAPTLDLIVDINFEQYLGE